MWKVGWESYLALISLISRSLIRFSIRGRVSTQKTAQRQGTSQGFQTEEKSPEYLFWSAWKVGWSIPPFCSLLVDTSQRCKGLERRKWFSYRKKKESNMATLIPGFIEAVQTTPENSLCLGALYFAWKGSLRSTLWHLESQPFSLLGDGDGTESAKHFQIRSKICQSCGNCQSHNSQDFL